VLLAGFAVYAAVYTMDVRSWGIFTAVVLLAIYFSVLSVGLWKGYHWAWWLSFATMVIEVPIGLYNTITQFSYWELARLLIATALALALYFGRKAIFTDSKKLNTSVADETLNGAPVIGGRLKRK
jgi:uncharacterized membrane protein (DUF2068 family)